MSATVIAIMPHGHVPASSQHFAEEEIVVEHPESVSPCVSNHWPHLQHLWQPREICWWMQIGQQQQQCLLVRVLRGPLVTAEQQARRALRDNFSTWTASEVLCLATWIVTSPSLLQSIPRMCLTGSQANNSFCIWVGGWFPESPRGRSQKNGLVGIPGRCSRMKWRACRSLNASRETSSTISTTTSTTRL